MVIITDLMLMNRPLHERKSEEIKPNIKKKNVSSGQLQMHLMFPPHWAMLGQVGASMMLLWTRPDDVTVMSCVSS